jgi:hypothetical protein
MDTFVIIVLFMVLNLIGIVFLGLIAGFSPTLSIAQVALSTKKRTAARYAYALMAGVLTATVILLVLFQFFSLNNLISTISSTVEALLISVLFNVVVGILFIITGVYYVSTRRSKAVYHTNTKAIRQAGGASAFFGFGFAKTLLSLSGITAVYLGGNIIASTTPDIIIRLVLILAFLGATIAPFYFTLVLIKKHPEKLEAFIAKVTSRIADFNYRLVVGGAAIVFGVAVIVSNCMLALFY